MPVYLLVGVRYTYAILAVLAMDLLLVVLTYVLGKRLFGTITGLLGAAIVALSPLDAHTSQLIMSDVPASALLMGSIVALTYVSWEDRPTGRWLALASPRQALLVSVAGCLFGYSLWVRQVDAFYLPAFVVFLVLGAWTRTDTWRANLTRALFGVACFLACALLFQAVVLIYNEQTFGSPLRTGYNFWVPYWYDDPRRTFSLAYAFGSAGQALTYLKALFGRPEPEYTGGPNQTLYSTPVAILAGIGLPDLRTSPLSGAPNSALAERTVPRGLPTAEGRLPLQFQFAILASLPVLTTFAMYSAYFFYALRFLHLAIPLVAVLASRVRRSFLSALFSWVFAKTRWQSVPLRGIATVGIAAVLLYQLGRGLARVSGGRRCF